MRVLGPVVSRAISLVAEGKKKRERVALHGADQGREVGAACVYVSV